MTRFRFARTASFACILIGISATAAFAQTQTTDERPAVGIGYQFVHFNADIGGLNYPLGFNVDGSWPLPMNRFVDIVGEFGWSRHSEDAFTENQTTFDGGVRGNYATTAARLYAQATFGLQHTGSDGFGSTDALFGLDGGVSRPVEQLGDGSVFGQFGYRRVFYEGTGENAFRFIVGVRLPIGEPR